jgi:hypothetical protein
MKLSRAMQLVFAGATIAFAVPAFATSSVEATAPISLCGGEKSEKKDVKKSDKSEKDAPKEGKGDTDGKEPAST